MGEDNKEKFIVIVDFGRAGQQYYEVKGTAIDDPEMVREVFDCLIYDERYEGSDYWTREIEELEEDGILDSHPGLEIVKASEFQRIPNFWRKFKEYDDKLNQQDEISRKEEAEKQRKQNYERLKQEFEPKETEKEN